MWEETLLCKKDGLLVSNREMDLLLAGAPALSESKEELTIGFTTEKVASVEKQQKIENYERCDIRGCEVKA